MLSHTLRYGYVNNLNVYEFAFERICSPKMHHDYKTECREWGNLIFSNHFFSSTDELSFWQRVKHTKVRNTLLISSFLPAILPSARRDKFQLFLQVNTPLFFENETGRVGCLFFLHRGKLRAGVLWWRLKRSQCFCSWFILLSLQHVFKNL